MITSKIWSLLLSFAIPMIISPGPGNTILAASGGKFGVRGSVPFWMGFEAGNLFWCLVYGFGLSQLVQQFPWVYIALKWSGMLYLLYLAYGFFKSSTLSKQEDLSALSFTDGFIWLSLHPKVHSLILVLFSQFLNPALPLVTQVVQIAIVFTVLGLGCHFLWIYAGQMIFRKFQSRRAMQWQGIGFGICMIAVAAFVALS